jgi:hypothetical protein
MAATHLAVSQWNGRVKFNGFFFAVNLNVIAASAFDADNLFDPDAVMVRGAPLYIPSVMRYQSLSADA